ncbi:MAG: 50S ribosomal protein L15 [Candidatus Brocadiae bacterium]|nr:50S ribosomal protein L15 [Candidatus Brocadiia bacterium]
MNLNDLNATSPRRKSRIRAGRGRGGKRGKTCGTGHGGQRSRSGGHGAGLYEGGQMPLFRKLPRRGFNNANFGTRYAVVNVGALDLFEDGAEVDAAALLSRGIITKLLDGVKILGDGEITRKLTVRAHRFSKTAIEKIQAAGGTAEVVGS